MEIQQRNGDLQGIGSNFVALKHESILLPTKNAIENIINVIQVPLDLFQQSHIELIKKYGGIKQPDGNWSLPDKTNVPPEFDKEFKELCDILVPLLIVPIDYNKINHIQSEFPYNFKLLKPFLDNFTD